MTDPLSSRHQRRVEAVHKALIEKIRSGLLRPGDRFVSARALSQRYEISYQTADRLLSQLAEEGYVVRRAQSGTFLPDAASVLTKPLIAFHSRGQRLGSFGCLLLQHLRRALAGLTGLPPLQFVKRERIVKAQQLIRETSRSLIGIGIEVGYTSPSHFARVFRRVVGVTPTEFRSSL
jgi:AraC-like DNA-binding protein